MPTYEYACRDCEQHVEVVQSFTDAPLTICGVCGGQLRKVFSAAGIIFKGSGYYVTDTRGAGRKGEGKGEGKSGEAKSGEGKSGDGKSGDGKGKGNDGGSAATSSGDAKSAPASTESSSTSSTPEAKSA